jgi:hypothetical protein
VLLTAVLVMVIAINAVLISLLLQPDRAVTTRQIALGTGDDISSPDAPTRSPTPSISIVSIPERLLFASSSKTAWRATVGDCNTPGKVERSTNGGVSWKRISRSGPAPIVQLGAEPNGNLFTIGGTRRTCSAHYVAYADDGTITASTSSPIDVWFPTPNNRDEINGPGETKAAPCKGHVVGLAPLDPSRALVVCDEGAVMITDDSGVRWRLIATVPETLAVAAGPDRYWIAGVDHQCDGVAVRSLVVKSGIAVRGRNICAPAEDVQGGRVAMAVRGDSVWLWTGNNVRVSTDNGQSWN